MADTIHRNFKQTSDAESAQSALLAAGFRSSAVKLNSHAATAADAATSAVENVIDALTPRGGPSVPAGPKPAALLSVDTDDDSQRAQAESIMAGYGGVEA